MRWIVALALFLAAAAAAHIATLGHLPRAAMDRAMAAIAESAGGANRWAHAPRVTADSRRVVKPSPDLAYSACVYDLAEGPVRLRVAPWEDYVSLSLYAGDTDNFFVISDRAMGPSAFEAVLVGPGAAAPDTEARVIESPSRRGVALVRRLAPDAFSFQRAAAARGRDVCARWAPPPR